MDRREFLKASLGTTAAFGLSGLTLSSRGAAATSAHVELVAEIAPRRLIDGSRTTIWRFRGLEGVGPGALASGIVASEGATLVITLFNDLERPIGFSVPGVLEDPSEIEPGFSRDYVLSPVAGTYLFRGEADGDLGLAMGLGGPMVVLPAGGADELFVGGPAFDRQYTLVLSDLDDRLNAAVSRGEPWNLERFEPNYFFVNGLSYPDTAADPNTRIMMNQGEQILLRFVNAGVLAHPMHFHGYHVNVAAKDRVPEAAIVEKDTVLVGPGSCVDVMLPVTQPGIFPLHTHYVPGVTADGVYLNPYGGALVVMEASAATS